MRREAEARKGVEEARLAVIRACGELRESEMFLSAVMADERSAVGGAAARAASSADAANTHESNLRESAGGGSGAEGSRGLPGASAHTPAGHTVQVSKYKFLRRREDSSARG